MGFYLDFPGSIYLPCESSFLKKKSPLSQSVFSFYRQRENEFFHSLRYDSKLVFQVIITAKRNILDNQELKIIILNNKAGTPKQRKSSLHFLIIYQFWPTVSLPIILPTLLFLHLPFSLFCTELLRLIAVSCLKFVIQLI